MKDVMGEYAGRTGVYAAHTRTLNLYAGHPGTLGVPKVTPGVTGLDAKP